jgi:hypothetical protein
MYVEPMSTGPGCPTGRQTEMEKQDLIPDQPDDFATSIAFRATISGAIVCCCSPATNQTGPMRIEV